MTKEEVIAKLNGIRQVNDLYARGETQEQYDRRMAQSAVAIERAISMLSKQPTVETVKREDADPLMAGYIDVKVNGRTITTFYDWQNEAAEDMKEELIDALGIERSDT